MSSYYSPPPPHSMPEISPIMPVTPTGPPPPINRSPSHGHSSSYYTPQPYTPQSPNPPFMLGQSNVSQIPEDPSIPDILVGPPAVQLGMPTMPSFPSAGQSFGTQTQPRTSLRYIFSPTKEEDRHSLDQRLPVPKYVRDSDVVEITAEGAQRKVWSVMSDTRHRETRVRDVNGTEVALFTWSTMMSNRLKLHGQAEVICREWMYRYQHVHLSRCRMIRQNGRPYIWISRGDVDIIEKPSRPGVPLAIVGRDSNNRVEIEAFHEAFEDANLLQTIVIATIYMRVGE